MGQNCIKLTNYNCWKNGQFRLSYAFHTSVWSLQVNLTSLQSIDQIKFKWFINCWWTFNNWSSICIIDKRPWSKKKSFVFAILSSQLDSTINKSVFHGQCLPNGFIDAWRAHGKNSLFEKVPSLVPTSDDVVNCPCKNNYHGKPAINCTAKQNLPVSPTTHPQL